MEKKYTGLQRDTKDKYYTIKHVVKYCLQKVKKI